jgi:hypothetical protein
LKNAVFFASSIVVLRHDWEGLKMFRKAQTNDAPPPVSIRSLDEAWRIIGIGKSSGYKLIASGELKTFRIGRRRMTDDDAINALIEKAKA